MKLILSPVRMDETLTASLAGEVLTLNGEALDLGGLGPGDVLSAETIDCRWIAGDVHRDADGVLVVPLILPHGPNAPVETVFPSDIVVEQDGEIQLPAFE